SVGSWPTGPPLTLGATACSSFRARRLCLHSSPGPCRGTISTFNSTACPSFSGSSEDIMKKLTPAATFDDVYVPEDGVDRRTAASVETGMQALANRDAAIIAQKGAADGLASLNAGSKVPDAQLGRGLADGVAGLNSAGGISVVSTGFGSGGAAAVDATG